MLQRIFRSGGSIEQGQIGKAATEAYRELTSYPRAIARNSGAEAVQS
jgi:hypothetical protein